MSRSLVFSEQFTESAPLVADALREHREDRAALLASLTASLQSDPRVRAVWFHGSFGRDEADDFSDLDLWVSVADEYAARASTWLCGHAAQAANFIGCKETFYIAPSAGSFFTSRQEGRQGLLCVDWAWQPESALTLPVDTEILFERNGEKARLPIPDLPAVELGKDISEAPVVGSLFFAWLMIGSTANVLARDPQSDMALMLYPRPALEWVITELGQESALLPIDWSVPETTTGKLERLRGLVQIVALAVEAAQAQDYLFPPRYLPCLTRHLDLVEAVLGSRV